MESRKNPAFWWAGTRVFLASPFGEVTSVRTRTFFLPPPLGEVPQCAHWGGEGASREGRPLSLALLDSSPRGGAKVYVRTP